VTGFVTRAGYCIGVKHAHGHAVNDEPWLTKQERSVMALQTCVNSVRGGKKIFSICTDDGGYAMIHACSKEEAKGIAIVFLLAGVAEAKEASEHEVTRYKNMGYRVTYMN
jgi:hypothetical protein